jgi:DNA-binding NarL/FixJ family response regulator
VSLCWPASEGFEKEGVVDVGILSSRVLIRSALATLLRSSGRVCIVLEDASGSKAFAAVKKAHPEILIVDSIDAATDVDTLAQLKASFPDTKSLLLIDKLDEQTSVRALRAGANGCVLTSYTPGALQRALQAVAQGEIWLGGQVANGIIAKYVLAHDAPERIPGGLTRRELEVLSLLSKGFRNKEIAASLFISEETIRTHLKSIYKKLNLNTRHGAALHYFHHTQRWPEEPTSPPPRPPTDSLPAKRIPK